MVEFEFGKEREGRVGFPLLKTFPEELCRPQTSITGRKNVKI